MRILYLYAELMGYTVATLEALVERNVEVHLVHWDDRKRSSYRAPDVPGVYRHQRSKMRLADLERLAEQVAPALTVVSGWMDRDYMKVARKLRREGRIVVAAVDNQWYGTMRQWMSVVLAKTGYFRRYYSHAWVAGVSQYEFVRRLGFRQRGIIFDLYTADVTMFRTAQAISSGKNEQAYPHRFLFVGRFVQEKGLDTLLDAWEMLRGDTHDWELHLVGDGQLNEDVKSMPGVVVQGFLQPDSLKDEARSAGCFVLPSRSEPWGVVVHEFASTGMPLVLSDEVGAGRTFLISGFNGYSFRANDVRSLASRMRQIMGHTDDELRAMAAWSKQLSDRIIPDTSAANLLSVLN